MATEYPALVQKLLKAGALLVGSSAAGSRESDWDLIVPSTTLWREIAPTLPKRARPNGLGGWRFHHEGDYYDVWPDSLRRYINEALEHTGTKLVIVGDTFELEVTPHEMSE